MARSNKASPRGKSKRIRPGKRLRTGVVFSDQMDIVPSKQLKPGPRFQLPGTDHHPSPSSMQDEARNTERRSHIWTKDSKLRHAPISFMSAGGYRSALQEDKEQDSSEQYIDQQAPSQQTPPVDASDLQLDDAGDKHRDVQCSSPDAEGIAEKLAMQDLNQHPEPPLFEFDVKGSRAVIETGFAPPIIRSASPSSTISNSSEEIVVFAGRGRNGQKKLHGGYSSSSKRRMSSEKPGVDRAGTFKGFQEGTFETLSSSPVTAIHVPKEDIVDVVHIEQTTEVHTVVSHGASRATNIQSNPRPHSGQRKRKSRRDEVEDALFEDYIANMQEHGSGDEFLERIPNQRELGGDHTELYGPEHAFKGKAKAVGRDGWESSDLRDFDDLSTSDEVLSPIQQILAKRVRSRGLQYLVVWEDQTADDARWITSTALTMEGAAEKIRLFEEDEVLAGYDDEPSSSTDDSEDEDLEDFNFNDDGGEASRWAEQEEIQREVSTMTDEQIARLLMKQEELGMGSDQLLLFDGNNSGSGIVHNPAGDNELDIGNRPRLRRSARLKKKRLLAASGPRVMEENYQGASALADAYDNFDMMDISHLDSRRKSKRGGPSLPFELSDPELQANLQTAWQNDRQKKKARKEQRQELRAMGLLGKNKGRPDLNAKYSDGMTLEQIKGEIKEFLLSSQQHLSLPPMDNNRRRIVHEISHLLGLKSKSVGQGRSRFATLIKTSRSPAYDQSSIRVVDATLRHKSVMVWRDKATRRPGGTTTSRKGNGGGFAASRAQYKDGDVVGAAAPELGIENKGRAMLEKMGWSTGTALGALDNKGILQPVTHVVKTSKAGLG